MRWAKFFFIVGFILILPASILFADYLIHFGRPQTYYKLLDAFIGNYQNVSIFPIAAAAVLLGALFLMVGSILWLIKSRFNWKIKLIIAVVPWVLLIWAAYPALKQIVNSERYKMQRNYVDKETQKAGYCDVSSDCVVISVPSCEFMCGGRPVNKKEVERITRLATELSE